MLLVERGGGGEGGASGIQENTCICAFEYEYEHESLDRNVNVGVCIVCVFVGGGGGRNYCIFLGKGIYMTIMIELIYRWI